MKKVIFESHCEDRFFAEFGGRKLTNSLRYFHPNVKLAFHGDRDIARLKAAYPWLTWAAMDPVICGQYASDYELVVHIDADSIVTGTLDGILSADYELAGVRNNNDDGYSSATGQCYGTHIKGIDAASQYLNAGLIAVRHHRFWLEFLEAVSKMGGESPFGEQDVWNRLFWSGKFDTKLLDPADTAVYYGVSAQLVPARQPVEYHWSLLYMDGNNLMLNGKTVKILHHANGMRLPKLQYQGWVRPDVKEFLDEITK